MINAIEEQTQNQKILIEQITMLYQSMGSLLLINLLISITLVYGFWDVIAHTTLAIWMGLMLVMLLVRVVFYWSYKNRFESHQVKLFSYFLIIGSASAGVIWGLGGILLFPPDLLSYQLFILLSLMAMVVGSTFTLSVYLPAFFAFAPLALLPITIYFFFMGESIYNTLGIVSVVFLIAVTSFNLKINRSFMNSLKMRYENLDLIEQLHYQKNEAERANAAKSKFLAAASHDLRQPLYALSLFTTVLDETVNDPKVNKVVDQINMSVNALKSLFDVLLDISLLDAGMVKADKSNFSLQDVFSNLQNDFIPFAAKKGLTLHWPENTYIVRSEPNLLEQILRNYLSNAIRYTQEGRIDVVCSSDDGQVTIKVIDTGLGIDIQEHHRIFSEFYQLSNSERDRRKGLGLGLSIVKRTADLLEHQIAIESQLGKGSVFSVIVAQADNLSKGTSPRKSSTNALLMCEISANPSSLIIVVDDEKNIREGLRDLLQLWGFDVIIAADVQGIIAQLTSITRQPDAIISDFRLRDNQTGIDVADAIHTMYGADIPTLIVTGDIEKERLIEMNTRNFEILYKPVPPLKLRAFLRSIELRHNK